MNKFPESVRRKLLKNKCIEKVTENHVVFTAEFKIKSLEEYRNGIPVVEIFASSGLDGSLFEEGYFSSCIKRWVKKANLSGKHSFNSEARGRPRVQKDALLESLSADELRDFIRVQEELIEQLKKRNALARKR